MRLVWFEGPIGRAHHLLKKEESSGKKVISLDSLSEFDAKVCFRDVFATEKNVLVVTEDFAGADSSIASKCSDWSDNDMFVFINRKRTSWTKCCSLAKEKQTFVEVPTKMTRNKAMQSIGAKMKLSPDEEWISHMVADSCSASAWSKDIDVEKMDMTLDMISMTFSKRKPRDKAELGCVLGLLSSDVLSKISDAQTRGDAIEFCRLHDTSIDILGSSIHALQAVSSSSTCKNSKLNMLKVSGASNSTIMEFKKNDGNQLWNQYIVNKFESNSRLNHALADFIGTNEASGIVPYGAWGSLAWSAVLLHKSGMISASEMSKIVSAYKSIRKKTSNATDSR